VLHDAAFAASLQARETIGLSTQLKSDFLREIVARGFMHQCTDLGELDALAARKPITAYIGFDATADSLHVGSLVQIMLLRLLQRTGHRPIALMGGGTTKIGDPSGKEESRRLLSNAEIASNIAGIQKVFTRFLRFGSGPTDAVMANNADWLDGLQYIPFLRDYGSHFSVNRMLSFDSVKLRLEREQSLTFLEFNYMILQAYDFLELARRHDCVLQLGGSDQWGNIVNGVELGRRIDNRPLFGLTSSLITTAAGAKMGKTASGAIWLNADRLSPYDYWQYFRNTDDADVGRFLRLFTDLPLAEIARLEALRGAEINDAKVVLANETTTLAHGAEAAAAAAETARRTFVEGVIGGELPTYDVPTAELKEMPVTELFHLVRLVASKGEARRLIRAGGARLNDQTVDDEELSVTAAMAPSDIRLGEEIKVSAGKKRHAVVRPV
jgi:tyrosyl-tRNA synthetase